MNRHCVFHCWSAGQRENDRSFEQGQSGFPTTYCFLKLFCSKKPLVRAGHCLPTSHSVQDHCNLILCYPGACESTKSTTISCFIPSEESGLVSVKETELKWLLDIKKFNMLPTTTSDQSKRRICKCGLRIHQSYGFNFRPEILFTYVY